jgi:putative NADH-flavin reductase
MNILIFGANGNIGTRVVSRLLNDNHQITGFVHGESHLPKHDHLKVIIGDVRSVSDVSQALQGVDVVISTLGSWGTKSKDILSTGMQVIIPAMEKAGIQRIVSLTGSGVLLSTDTVAWYDRLNPLLLHVMAPKILLDGEKHIQELSSSNLDWTVVRSPVMKNDSSDTYTLSNTPALPWKRASRDAVAHAIVDLALSSDRLKQAPFLA